MMKDWAFAADTVATKVSTEFSVLFAQALTARFGDLTTPHSSTADQAVDALALEAAAAQKTPELIAA
jgi:hypothetical protein